MMSVMDQSVYAGSWAILVLYALTTLLVFSQRTCSSYAASFVFACALWLDLALFNIWFLLPAFARHLAEVVPQLRDAQVTGPCDVLRGLLTSYAAEDLGLIILGWLASSLSVFNSLSMWETEGCHAAPNPEQHAHGRVATLVIRAADGLKHGMGFDQLGDATGESIPVFGRRSIVFALPRFAYRCIQYPTRRRGSGDIVPIEKLFLDEKLGLKGVLEERTIPEVV
ncbi:hypothetical protein F4778DRAFT_758548 [Xylariomycetidae sp. FL2044]|nr:hypothetical protein F4778DRAFT_758548 [Xylariomycetidae sp. FL2044]